MTGASSSPWLQRGPTPTAAGRIFCVPHAGCGVSIFRHWPEKKDGVEFLPVDLPGRLTRFAEPMPATFQELATGMVAGLAPYLDKPFALFGHCWSALAAFEFAIALDRAGLPTPVRLFVSAQPGPRDAPEGRLLAMTETELSDELDKVVRDMGQRPHPELVSIYVDILRADLDVSRRYAASDPAALPCPVIALGWREDTDVPPERMRGWADCPDVEFTVHPGGHSRFVDAPSELLTQLVGPVLDASERRRP